MSEPKFKQQLNAEIDTILNYLDSSKGLRGDLSQHGQISLSQKIDSQKITFYAWDVQEVLKRTDSEGNPFLQVNFRFGQKILLTDALVGFKPVETMGLDMTRLPKVVTTPDLESVSTAIEEALGSDIQEDEVEILKKVFQAILAGGERVGFDLQEERQWFNRLVTSKMRAAA